MPRSPPHPIYNARPPRFRNGAGNAVLCSMSLLPVVGMGGRAIRAQHAMVYSPTHGPRVLFAFWREAANGSSSRAFAEVSLKGLPGTSTNSVRAPCSVVRRVPVLKRADGWLPAFFLTLLLIKKTQPPLLSLHLAALFASSASYVDCSPLVERREKEEQPNNKNCTYISLHDHSTTRLEIRNDC